MACQPRLECAVRLHLPRKCRIGGDRGSNAGFVSARQLAIGKGREFFRRHTHASSPSSSISASRPRTSRELSVPTGQPTTSAASLYE